MATSSQLRSWWAAYRCQPSKMVRVPFPGVGRTWSLLVAEEASPAWQMFIALMIKHRYYFIEIAGGTYHCRKIAGKNSWSLHSYGTAVDLNPKKNPYKKPLTHNYPQAFINDVLALKATDGTPLFRWGGTWRTPDAMHWEINCKPSAIPKYTGDEYEMQRGDEGRAVAEVQHILAQDWNYDNGDWTPRSGKSNYTGKSFAKGEDGDFGGHLETLVAKFQKSQGIPETGRIDGVTHSMIFGRRGGATVDATARKAAASAQGDATAAHSRLNKLHAI